MMSCSVLALEEVVLVCAYDDNTHMNKTQRQMIDFFMRCLLCLYFGWNIFIYYCIQRL